MSVVTFLALWLTMRACPDTPVGKWLRLTMVDLPAAWLTKLTRGHMLIGVTVFASTAFVLWLIGSEAARMLSIAAPDMLVWMTTFEMTSYVDALAAVTIAASSVRLRALKSLLPRRLLRRRDVARVVRARRVRRPTQAKADNDNDDPAALILVFA